MEKIILADGTELQIKPGASLANIIFEVAGFAELEAVAGALQTPGNLDKVQFTVDGSLSGEYVHMRVTEPLFKEIVQEDGKLSGTFGLEKKTAVEIQMEAVQAENKVLRDNIAVQDGAIMELAEMISVIAGGEME